MIPQEAAAVVSAIAIIAALAIVLSIIGLVSSTRASTKAQAAREAATNAQWKMSEHLEAIAAAQADAAQALAAGGSAPIGVDGKLSARMMSTGRHNYKLVVANVGAQVLTIEAIEAAQKGVLIGGQDVTGAELESGEDVCPGWHARPLNLPGEAMPCRRRSPPLLPLAG